MVGLIVSVFDRREIALIVFLINLGKKGVEKAAENVPTESEVNLLTEKDG